jgi:hypothetical protein
MVAILRNARPKRPQQCIGVAKAARGLPVSIKSELKDFSSILCSPRAVHGRPAVRKKKTFKNTTWTRITLHKGIHVCVRVFDQTRV